MLNRLIILLIAALSVCALCPTGYVRESKPGFRVTVNGCGPQASRITGPLNSAVRNFQPEFISCCNSHDKCYADCTKTRSSCDLAFKNCMLSKCDDTACRLAANTMYQAVNLFGTNPYNNAQQQACKCVKRGPSFLEKITDMYKNLYNAVQEEMVENDIEGSEDDVGALEYNVEDDVDTLGYDDLLSFLETVTE